jgi:Endosomal/lysosomal potassium channel TMEM175
VHRLNLNQIKVEYVVSFSDALFAFSITFMALSIQIPTFSSNIAESELTRRLGQLLIPNIIHYIVSFMVVSAITRLPIASSGGITQRQYRIVETEYLGKLTE